METTQLISGFAPVFKGKLYYDTTGTLAMADKLEKEIPGARKMVFPGTAHMIPMEQSKRFNEVVLNFLQNEV